MADTMKVARGRSLVLFLADGPVKAAVPIKVGPGTYEIEGEIENPLGGSEPWLVITLPDGRRAGAARARFKNARIDGDIVIEMHDRLGAAHS